MSMPIESNEDIPDTPDGDPVENNTFQGAQSEADNPSEQIPSLISEQSPGDNLVTNDEVPAWLEADLDSDRPDDEAVPDWLKAELSSDEASDSSELPDDGMAKDLDATIISTRPVDFFDDVMSESVGEKPSSLDQENLERAGSDDLNWLDQIASGEGAAIEEPPTMSWDQEESDELTADDSAFNEEPSWLTEVETSPRISVEDRNFNESNQSLESLAGLESDSDMPVMDLDDADGNFSDISSEVPEDPDEAMAWLEQLAARQGASLDELPTVTESNESSFEQIPSVQENVPYLDRQEAVTFEDTELIDLENEAPDDPDDAMEWLERLASQQGAINEKLPSLPDDVKTEDDKAVNQYVGERDEELEKALAELEDIEMPEDPEEAMVWLNELAGVTESISISKADELGMETVEEPLTPASPHDVIKSRVEAEEILIDQPEIFTAEESAGPAGSNIEEEEALAWLDQLANHQSVDFEEADSVSEYDDDEISDSLRSDDKSATSVKTMNMTEEVDSISDTSQTGAGVIHDELGRAELGAESSFGEEIEDEELDLPRTGMTKEFAKQDVSESLPAWLALEHQEDSLEDMADDSPVNSATDSDKNELAWLDSLGELNAIESLESPDEELEAEFVGPVSRTELQPTAVLQTEDEVADSEAIRAALEDSEKISVDHASKLNQERLQNARFAVEVGNVDSAVSEYSVLVDDGEGLPFLIADLESAVHEHEGELLLQRVLGDAYVRNGQIHKALETYRQALDHL